MKISGVYKITNTITGDFYIGSSKNVKRRWASHKNSYTWKNNPNNPMYLDMKKYGLEKFAFEILEEVEIDKLKEVEQKLIEILKPIYNNYNANGLNVERKKESQKKYEKTDRYKEYQKEYRKSDKYKESHRKSNKQYRNQLCCYNGETLTLCALSTRFRRAGIPHPNLEAKKYIIKDYFISPSL